MSIPTLILGYRVHILTRVSESYLKPMDLSTRRRKGRFLLGQYCEIDPADTAVKFLLYLPHYCIAIEGLSPNSGPLSNIECSFIDILYNELHYS